MASITSKSATLGMCFSVGAVLFSSHAGGGFATGNQENVYFVSLGWLGPITAIFTMLLFTLTIKEAMHMYNSRRLTSYRQLFKNLYAPVKGVEYLFELFFYIMVLMAVSATVSGAATAIQAQTGVSYATGIGIVGAIIFLLTIFGANLVRRATSYMGAIILALVIGIFSVGIMMSGSVAGTQTLGAVMAQDFATNGISKLPTAILHAFTYAGFQCVVIPTMIMVGRPLLTRRDCARSMWMSFAINSIALTLAVSMLMGWTSIYKASPLPTLDSLKSMNFAWLTLAYSFFLLLCLISTGVTTVFGFTARFSEVKWLKKMTPNGIVRSAVVALSIIVVSMTVSFVGLTNIIKYGYGYCGYLAILIIIVPFLTVGRYKNKRYMADDAYRARIDAMNEVMDTEMVAMPKDMGVARS